MHFADMKVQTARAAAPVDMNTGPRTRPIAWARNVSSAASTALIDPLHMKSVDGSPCRLPLEEHPCGERQQGDRDAPQGCVAHSRFLSHAEHFMLDPAPLRNSLESLGVGRI
jgi:hypothetical protein